MFLFGFYKKKRNSLVPNIVRLCICLLVLFSNLLSANELKQITLQLSWYEQFQFAGYYMAKEKGFYNEAGLTVNIKPFDIKNQPLTAQKVTNGEIDFAVAKETLILSKSHNEKIVLLYALFQSSPLVLLSTKASRIKAFEDFSDKRIMASITDAQQASLKAMLTSNGVKEDKLTFLQHTHRIEELINNKTDLISAYISKAPYYLEKMGVEYNIFNPKDYGFDLYSDFLYTSERFMANDLDTAKAFREASLRGFKYAFDNITETVDVIFEQYNEQKLTKKALFFEGTELKKLAYLNTSKIGVINENKIRKSFELYKVLGIEKETIDFTQLIYNAKEPTIFLTEREKSYLEKIQKITLCIDPNWLPYEGFDNNGKHIGTNTEFLDIFRKQLPIPIETVETTSWSESVVFAQQRKCDLLSLAASTPERKKYLNFTSPYLIFPLVLVTKTHSPFINNFTLLANKIIGVPKGYAHQDIIKKNYPDIIIVEVETIKDGLEKVANGSLYGFIGSLNTIDFFLEDEFLGKLKVSGKFDEDRKVGIGVRNDEPLLLSVFEKLVSNLSQEQINNITEKKTLIKYVDKVDYNLLKWILFIVLMIVLAFLYRQSVLKSLNKKLNRKVAEKTKALLYLNASLELRIQERTEKIEHSKELLQNVAYRDHLTGIFNRHYLLEKSDSFFQESDLFNHPLSILLIDIDYFKKVNDVYGHITGDKILKYFVKNIQKTLRTDDLFARYGGEEFILLLPKTSLNESLIVAEKLRIIIEQNPYHSERLNTAINITISIGASQYKKGDILEGLIDKADSALYRAKEEGRNQVQITSRESL